MVQMSTEFVTKFAFQQRPTSPFENKFLTLEREHVFQHQCNLISVLPIYDLLTQPNHIEAKTFLAFDIRKPSASVQNENLVIHI